MTKHRYGCAHTTGYGGRISDTHCQPIAEIMEAIAYDNHPRHTGDFCVSSNILLAVAVSMTMGMSIRLVVRLNV